LSYGRELTDSAGFTRELPTQGIIRQML